MYFGSNIALTDIFSRVNPCEKMKMKGLDTIIQDISMLMKGSHSVLFNLEAELGSICFQKQKCLLAGDKSLPCQHQDPHHHV